MTKRFFWYCAGADKEILERSPYSEHVRYASLGGIVLATGIMAGSAGAFGFYTVFKSVLGACIFGFLWGLMIQAPKIQAPNTLLKTVFLAFYGD